MGQVSSFVGDTWNRLHRQQYRPTRLPGYKHQWYHLLVISFQVVTWPLLFRWSGVPPLQSKTAAFLESSSMASGHDGEDADGGGEAATAHDAQHPADAQSPSAGDRRHSHEELQHRDGAPDFMPTSGRDAEAIAAASRELEPADAVAGKESLETQLMEASARRLFVETESHHLSDVSFSLADQSINQSLAETACEPSPPAGGEFNMLHIIDDSASSGAAGAQGSIAEVDLEIVPENGATVYGGEGSEESGRSGSEPAAEVDGRRGSPKDGLCSPLREVESDTLQQSAELMSKTARSKPAAAVSPVALARDRSDLSYPSPAASKKWGFGNTTPSSNQRNTTRPALLCCFEKSGLPVCSIAHGTPLLPKSHIG